MRDRTRIFLLILVMSIISISILTFSMIGLYIDRKEDVFSKLREIVVNQARFIEAVAEYDIDDFNAHETNKLKFKTPTEATLYQIKKGHSKYKGFGETGEFTLAGLKGNEIHFILSHRHKWKEQTSIVKFNESRAVPMKMALSGKSGTITALDYRGEKVVAAYEPVKVLNLGLVAKIDLKEIRAPFIRFGVIFGIITIVLVSIGSYLFFRLTNPIFKELSETEERYKGLVDNINGMVYSAGADWVPDFISNVKKITGYSPEEFKSGKVDWRDIVHEDDRDRFLYESETLYRGETSIAQEYRILPKNSNEPRWVLDNKTSRFSKNKTFAGVSGVLFDISEKKEAENERKELQKSLLLSSKLATIGELSSGVAHEINNPLAIILGNLETAKYKYCDLNKELTDFINDSIEEVDRIKTIVNNLQEYSRADINLNTTLDINNSIRKTVELISNIYEKENVKIKLSLDSHIDEVLASDGKFRQCFLNLVSNAKDSFNGEEGEILIRTYAFKDKVVLEVSDNGEGIKEEDFDKIFDMFYTSKDVGKGTGIGLSLTQSIVNSLGGDISVSSKVNVGSQFKISLPASKIKSSSIKENGLQKENIKKLNGKILIVDDESKLRRVLKLSLTRFGLTVDEALNGEEALKKIRSSNYDYVLLDIKMPIMSGSEFISTVKNEKIDLPKTAILTGCVVSEYTGDELSIIKDDFKIFKKPVKSEELYAWLTEDKN